MTSDEYLNLKEAARYLGVSEIKIRRLVSKGLLKVSADPLDDRKRLVKKSDLDALRTPRPFESATFEQQQRRSGSPPQKKRILENQESSSNET